jgi:hypothetical protein
MNFPIAIICGGAGDGKDTVAAYITKHCNAVSIAQADPMKRFAATVFGCSEHQLWGPSDARNAPDERFASEDAWTAASLRVLAASAWLRDIGVPNVDAGLTSLWVWFIQLAEAHGFASVGNRMVRVGRSMQILTPRYALQTLGTEWGRTVSPLIWNDCALRTARALLTGGPRYTRTVGLTDDVSYHPPDFVIITDGRFRNEVLRIIELGGVTIQVSSPTAAALDAGVKGHRSEAELKSIPSSWFRFRIMNDKRRGLEALDATVAQLVAFMVSGPAELRL